MKSILLTSIQKKPKRGKQAGGKRSLLINRNAKNFVRPIDKILLFRYNTTVMMYLKAKAEDYDELVAFIDDVFSRAGYSGLGFLSCLPKSYKREYFMDAAHYIARDDNTIKGVVGAFPLAMQVFNFILPGRGISAVSVHPDSREQGVMKKLMNMALDDMKKDGVAFSCLSGERQRYEYYGYTPAGIALNFDCTKTNCRHTLGKHFKSNLAVKQVSPTDTALLDAIRATHEAKTAKLYRPKARFYDYIKTWEATVAVFLDNGKYAGYIIHYPDCANQRYKYELTHRCEINLTDTARLPEAALAFMESPLCQAEHLQFRAAPFEEEKAVRLRSFAADWTISPAYKFNILDWQPMLQTFIRLAASRRPIPPGALTVAIQDDGHGEQTFRITNNGVTATNAPPDIRLSHLEAAAFFFAPLGEHIARDQLAGKPDKLNFVHSLLPLPLFWEDADSV
jgi:predicted N-acetyltransferase YhbS